MFALPKPWRALHTFQASLAVAFLGFLASVFAALFLYLDHGDLTRAETTVFLQFLYFVCYPALTVALVSITWHLIQFYRGAYARAF